MNVNVIPADWPPTRMLAHKAAKLRALATLASNADKMHRLGHALAEVGMEEDGWRIQCIAEAITKAMEKLEIPDLVK